MLHVYLKVMSTIFILSMKKVFWSTFDQLLQQLHLQPLMRNVDHSKSLWISESNGAKSMLYSVCLCNNCKFQVLHSLHHLLTTLHSYIILMHKDFAFLGFYSVNAFFECLQQFTILIIIPFGRYFVCVSLWFLFHIQLQCNAYEYKQYPTL